MISEIEEMEKQTIEALNKPANPERRKQIGVTLGIVAVVASAAALFIFFWQRFRVGKQPQHPELIVPPAGLSEAEAAARHDPESDVDNIIRGKGAISRQEIIRHTTFSIFNLNLVFLAIIQLLFVRPLDAIITLGIIVVNVVANVFQYEIANRRLNQIQEDTRPRFTVMRDGMARSVDSREIVTGDILTAGRGDQIIADGPIVGQGSLLVDETMLGTGSGSVRKKTGDQLLAGSICLNGRAAYRADVLGEERKVIQYLHSLPAEKIQLTAIEKILNGIMRILLVIMIALVTVIIIRSIQTGAIGQLGDNFDPIIVILNLVPASLFFMVVITYISATVDLAKFGALVHQSRTVESLAQLDVLCFAKAGFLTGIGAHLEPVAGDQENQEMPLPRIRQILGDFAHSNADTNHTLHTLRENFTGSRRKLKESAPFFAAFGWSGLVFDDDELQGAYVLVEPELLRQNLAALDEDQQEKEGEEEHSITKSLSSGLRRPFSRFLHREKKEEGEDNVEEDDPEEVVAEPGDDSEDNQGIFGRWRSRVQDGVSSLMNRDPAESEEEPEETTGESNGGFIFAYNPRINSLTSGNDEWQLPEELIPLCHISFEERVKPEARDAIQVFNQQGVAVKIFTPDDPEKTAARLREAGVSLIEDPELTIMESSELEGLETAEIGELAQRHTVIGNLSPQQAANIVAGLRQIGSSVGVAGDGVSDVAALRKAEVAIVRKSSSPAVLDIGDIILLEEGQTTFTRVLEKGQRIVNGLLDILKLYLTQIFYLLFLIITIPLLISGFPYTSQQAGLIALITLTIPALALTLWASAGKLPRVGLGRILVNFIAPTALSIAVLGFLVYYVVWQQAGSVPYAQVVLTYALISMGLLLVINIKPPLHIHGLHLPQIGDVRPTILVIISFIVFIIITRIPFIAELFGIIPLQRPVDFALVMGAAIIWVIVVRVFWWLFPVVSTVGEGAIQVVEGGTRQALTKDEGR